jgi:hypothetical protein
VNDIMPTTFVCLDTNILYRFATQGQKGCEPVHWRALLALVEKSKVKLLMPEVVALEFEKLTSTDFDVVFAENMKGFETSFTDLFKDTSKSQRGIYWNEAGDIVRKLEKYWSQLKTTKLAAFRKRSDTVLRWLESFKHIPLTEAILLATKKRRIADRFGGPEDRKKEFAENDCLIIDSLIAAFRGKLLGKELLLCTGNIRDFGVTTADGKTTLHDAFRLGLPPTAIFADLKCLVAFIKNGKPVAEPAPEEIAKAEKERAERIKREQQEATEWPTTFSTINVGATTSAAPLPITYYYPMTVDGHAVPNFYVDPDRGFVMTIGQEEEKRRKAEEDKRQIQMQLERQRLRDQIGR